MLQYALLAGAVCCLSPALARAQDAPIHAYYAGYSHGFNILNADTALTLNRADYRLQISYHFSGLISVLVHSNATITVDGRLAGNQAEPRQYFSAGVTRGDQRVTQINWQDGMPKVLQMIPPVEAERDPVPPSEQAHTIDTLSAVVVLMRQVTETGRCDGVLRTFDGRRLAEIAAQTVGEETLEQTGRSSFQGQALRCDFQARQLAGFFRDADPQAVRRPQPGSAWFARLQPGQPLLPVRITVNARLVGDTTLYLTTAPQ